MYTSLPCHRMFFTSSPGLGMLVGGITEKFNQKIPLPATTIRFCPVLIDILRNQKTSEDSTPEVTSRPSPS